MTDETTMIEAGLKSGVSADLSVTEENPLGPEAREADRIARIKTLSGQFHKNSTGLLLAGYRLGLELKALRDQTEHGRWEKLFDTELTFISKRTANDLIALARSFKSEAQLAGFTLTQALDAARPSSRKPPSGDRQAPSNEARSYLRKLARFRGYLDRTDLSELNARLAASDRDEAHEHWTAIVQAGDEAISDLDHPRKTIRARKRAPLPSPAKGVTPSSRYSKKV